MTRKALIVEDEDSWLDLLSVILKDAHYQPVRASTAHQALKLAKKDKPDLVILDIGLPDGDGESVLEALRELPGGKDLPVVVLSAYHREEVTDLDFGGAIFLSKDQGLPPLLAAIQSA